MAISRSSPTPHLHTHAYETSTALAKLCAHLYGYDQAQFEEFCQRSQSRINTPIWEIASKKDLAIEPDFALRQFLWFIRPPETLEFFDKIAPLWPIVQALSKAGGTDQYLPVKQLEQTWLKISLLIAQYPGDFPKLKTPKPGAQANKNLMVDHRSATYPMFTALVNYPDLQKSGGRPLYPHYQRLQAYFVIQEARLLKQQKEDGKDDSYHPYNFLLSATTQSGLGKIAQVSRFLRRWGDDLNTSVIAGSLNRVLTHMSYAAFIHDLQANKPVGVDEDFLEYFTHHRGFRKAGSPSAHHSGRRSQSEQGGMDWPYDLASITQESDVDSIEQIITTLAQPDEDELALAENLGEDPFEDQLDEPQVDLAFHDGSTQASLSFEHYTSYAQQLTASRHQRFWWDGFQWTHEDMQSFMRFLDRENSPAAKILKIIPLIGIDLAMACRIYVRPDISSRWLNGGSGFPAEGISEPTLMISQVKELKGSGNHDPVYLWIYPIKMVAFQKVGTLQDHHHHGSYLPFRDQSGLGKALLGVHPHKPIKITKTRPLFDHPEQVEQACLDLLKKFNLQWEQANTLAEKRPKLSIAQLQAFAHKERQRLGIDPLLLDHLDWHTPTPFRSSLHYYSHSLHQVIIPSKQLGLQFALSQHTGIFGFLNGYGLAPTKNLIIGANTLVESDFVLKSVTGIKQLLKQKLLKPNRQNIGELANIINHYSFYICLWFCFETSHRPHHIPYKSSNEIDPLHGLVLLLDKTQPDGSKARLAHTSQILRSAIKQYEQDMSQLELLLQTLNPEMVFPKSCPIYLVLPDGDIRPVLKTIGAEVFDSKHFGAFIKRWFGEQIKPNFYRHYMVHQLYLHREEYKISDDEIKQWLGHWVHGTQPFHEFSSNSPLHNIDQLAPVIQKIIGDLGFEAIDLRLPRGYNT